MAEAGRPLRLVFVNGSLGPGGAERFTTNLANHWAGKGHKVSILLLSERVPPAYEIDPRVELIVLDRHRGSPTPLHAVADVLRRRHRLRRQLRQLQPDGTIGVMTYANCLLALAGPVGGVRIGSERNYPPRMRIGRAWIAVRRAVYRRLDVVVAQTRETADWLLKNVPVRAVEVIPNPVIHPLPVGTPVRPPQHTVPEGRRLLVGIGRLHPQKRFDRLIDAFAAIAGRHPEWDLAILGEGPLRAELEARIAAAELTDRIHLVGQTGNLADWFGRADLFALTSDHEGFPNVLLEALAHGLPAVSVDCMTGPRQILRDGTDGLLVPEGDPAALAQALDRVMGDDALRARLAARATEVLDRFAPDRIAGQWEALVRRGRGA